MALHSSRGDTRTALLHGVSDMIRTFAWLEDDRRPLDWNGPANRLFTRFRDQDLQRPIIEHFEQVARRHRGRIAIKGADTALTFGELWDGVSGLAQTLVISTASKPCFAGTRSCEMSPQWHGRVVPMTRRPSSPT